MDCLVMGMEKRLWMANLILAMFAQTDFQDVRSRFLIRL
jgi:hypothetical protein